MNTSTRLVAEGALAPNGAALVLLNDNRAALQAVLVLQEFGMAVDVAQDRLDALLWASRARYDLIVLGGAQGHEALALLLRRAAPQARVVLFSRERPRQSLAMAGIRTIEPPVNVNTLARVARAA
jgi:DNA-binding response OmpR family regulator